MTSIDQKPDFYIHYIFSETTLENIHCWYDLKTKTIMGDNFFKSYNNRIALLQEDSELESLFTPPNNRLYYNDYYTTLKKSIENIIKNNKLTPQQKIICIIDLQATVKEGLLNRNIILCSSNAVNNMKTAEKEPPNDGAILANNNAVDNLQSYILKNTITLHQIYHDKNRLAHAENRVNIYIENEQQSTEEEKIKIQNEILMLQAENNYRQNHIVRLQNQNERSKSILEKLSKFKLNDLPLTFNPFYIALMNLKKYQKKDIKTILKDNVLKITNNSIQFQPQIYHNFGQYLRLYYFDSYLDVNTFLYNTFDGLISGVEIGNWSELESMMVKNGPEMIIGTIILICGDDLIPAIAETLTTLGLDYIITQSIMLYNSYQDGIFSRRYLDKLHHYMIEQGMQPSHNIEDMIFRNASPQI